MIAAPKPTYEPQRIAALKALNILDTPNEERFDRFTRIATRLFDVPTAYIAMVDTDRQWFKASAGVCVKQTARDISFCGHAILGEDTLVVPDALKDPRFADNPMVKGEPYTRFYAGHPLRAANGQKVGTFCISDRRPRQFSDAQLQAFKELAAIVERELNLADVIRLQSDLLAAEEQAMAAEKERADALGRLVESQKHLARELAEAASYVRSILPAPLKGDVETHWCFHPCSALGGDSFGYHWLDPRRIAIYLLDVCGHGVGSALLSISAMNLLRAEALPEADFGKPAEVLTALNRAFPMERNDNRFFTIWYGVYDRARRRLDYSAGGHPPALFIPPGAQCANGECDLGNHNFFIGLDASAQFESSSVEVPPASRLYVFSDGAYEVAKNDKKEMMQRSELTAHIRSIATKGNGTVDAVFKHILHLNGSDALPDDFSLLEVAFH